MGDIEVARWNGVDFLVPKHLRKSKIGLLEQIWAKNPYVAFFLGHPVQIQIEIQIQMEMEKKGEEKIEEKNKKTQWTR